MRKTFQKKFKMKIIHVVNSVGIGGLEKLTLEFVSKRNYSIFEVV